MKLHKDGSVEGTPKEIIEYNILLKEGIKPVKLIPNEGVIGGVRDNTIKDPLNPYVNMPNPFIKSNQT